MIWWILGTYLLIGVATTLTSCLGKKNSAIRRKHDIRWQHIILSLFIGPLFVVYIEFGKVKKARKNG